MSLCIFLLLIGRFATRAAVTCPVLPTSLSNGFVYGSLNVYDGAVLFSCSHRYHITGQPASMKSIALKCQDNGQWDRPTPTCTGKCFIFFAASQCYKPFGKKFRAYMPNNAQSGSLAGNYFIYYFIVFMDSPTGKIPDRGVSVEKEIEIVSNGEDED